MKVVCFGPGPKFKGGISNYNTSLAKALDKLGHDVHIVSWTQQYPAIIPREFVDKSSKADLLEGTNIQVSYLLNYNNPASWKKAYKAIVALKPDKVIIQWAIAIQGLPLGYLSQKLSRHDDIEVIFDLHFVIQKENSKLDRFLTKKGIQFADTFVTHSAKTNRELEDLLPSFQQKIHSLYHPVYDIFKPNTDFDVAGFKKEHGLKEHVFLFFGFIRKYKGLHHAIEAFKRLAEQRNDVSLLICGESFWNTLDSNKWSTKLKKAIFGGLKKIFLSKKADEKDYRPLELIRTYGLEEQVVVFNDFIPNEDVHKYFQVSDAVVLFYEYATPSGVESLSYNFSKPILASKVGHFPEAIVEGKNGYLANAEDIEDMARVMHTFIEQPIAEQKVAEFASRLSWENYAKTIMG